MSFMKVNVNTIKETTHDEERYEVCKEIKDQLDSFDDEILPDWAYSDREIKQLRFSKYKLQRRYDKCKEEGFYVNSREEQK